MALGVALAICRSIIKAHGGALSASPNLPCGGVFSVHPDLPAKLRQQSALCCLQTRDSEQGCEIG
jgi:K+-sensing histidine kinase KdpD